MTIQICRYKNVIQFDSSDWALIAPFTWTVTVNGYAHSTSVKSGGHILMHRLLMGLKPHDGIIVDHINHNKSDNRRCNLRIATKAENCRNRKANKGSSSRFCGVYIVKGSKEGRIYIKAGLTTGGKRIHLGSFASEREAAIAYNNAALKYYGEFANLNKID